MTKKISIIIILAILVCFGLYFYLSAPKETVDDQKTIAQKISSFFPTAAVKNFLAGSSTDNSNLNSNPDTTNNGGVSQNTLEAGQIYKLVEGGVAGAYFLENNGTTTIAYVEKTTGHIFQLNPQTKEKTRISNTTLPGIYSTFWGEDKKGLRVIERYLKNGSIQNYSNTITKTLTNSSSQGTLISLPLTDLAVSPTKSSIVSLRKSDDSTIVATSDFDGSNQKTILSTPHNEWLISWPEINTVALQSKTSANTESFLYFLNPTTNSFKKVLGGLGLDTLVSPDAKKVLYSTGNMLSLALYDRPSKKSSSLSFKTLAEKCVWSKKFSGFYCAVPTILPTGQYPDGWYSGEKSFNDDLWVTNLTTSTSFNIYNSKESKLGVEIDVTKLNLNKNEDALIFINKKDNSLWYMDMKDYFKVASTTKPNN